MSVMITVRRAVPGANGMPDFAPSVQSCAFASNSRISRESEASNSYNSTNSAFSPLPTCLTFRTIMPVFPPGTFCIDGSSPRSLMTWSAALTRSSIISIRRSRLATLCLNALFFSACRSLSTRNMNSGFRIHNCAVLRAMPTFFANAGAVDASTPSASSSAAFSFLPVHLNGFGGFTFSGRFSMRCSITLRRWLQQLLAELGGTLRSNRSIAGGLAVIFRKLLRHGRTSAGSSGGRLSACRVAFSFLFVLSVRIIGAIFTQHSTIDAKLH